MKIVVMKSIDEMFQCSKTVWEYEGIKQYEWKSFIKDYEGDGFLDAINVNTIPNKFYREYDAIKLKPVNIHKAFELAGCYSEFMLFKELVSDKMITHTYGFAFESDGTNYVLPFLEESKGYNLMLPKQLFEVIE